MRLNKYIIHSQSHKSISGNLFTSFGSRKTSNNAESDPWLRAFTMHFSLSHTHTHPYTQHQEKAAQLHGADGAVNAYLMNVGVIFGLRMWCTWGWNGAR
jgi:hypothetical protein